MSIKNAEQARTLFLKHAEKFWREMLPKNADEQASIETWIRVGKLFDLGKAMVQKELPRPMTALEAASRFHADDHEALVSLVGWPAPIIEPGGVCVLTGIQDKFVLALQLAAAVCRGDGGDIAGLFSTANNSRPVLWISFHMEPHKIGTYMFRMSKGFDMADTMHVLDLRDMPLYGSLDSADRPQPLRGMDALTRAVNEVRPGLIVIDRASSAYAGDFFNPLPIARFVGELRCLARTNKAGILMIADDSDPQWRTDATFSLRQAFNKDPRRLLLVIEQNEDRNSHVCRDVIRCVAPEREVVPIAVEDRYAWNDAFSVEGGIPVIGVDSPPEWRSYNKAMGENAQEIGAALDAIYPGWRDPANEPPHPRDRE